MDKMKKVKVAVSVIGICLMVGFLALDSSSQSYWEQRQKSQDQLRKKQLGITTEEKEAPKEKPKEPASNIKEEPKKSAEESVTPNDEDFDLGLGLEGTAGTAEEEYTGEDYDITEDTAALDAQLEYDVDLDLGNKEIKKLADKNTYIDPYKIKIDENYGTIKEVNLSKTPNAPLIIHIQDAHVNYDAQVSIAHLIEGLLADYGVNQIYIEGGSLEDNAPSYTNYYNKYTRIERAKKLLKEGIFTGVSYLYAATSYPIEIKGIEDKKINDENDKLYFEVEELRPKAREYLDSLKINISNLKPVVFSKEINELVTNKDNYITEKMTLNNYVKFLSEKAKNSNMEIKSKYPNVAGLVETITMEEGIDFPAVDTEREKLITSLKTKLSKENYAKLEAKQTDFIIGKVKGNEFYAYLVSLEKGDLTKDYANLVQYSKYLNEFGKIDTFKLFKEIEDLETEIKASLYKNDEEKQLDKISYDFSILREFVELGLTPDEYTYYSNNRADFNISKWVDTITKLQKKYKLNKPVPRNMADAQRIIPKLEEFYKTAILRDKILIDKSLAYLKNSNLNTAIMICGGFHTPRITGIMRTLGASYMVIAPKINNPTEPGLYDKIMRLKSGKTK